MVKLALMYTGLVVLIMLLANNEEVHLDVQVDAPYAYKERIYEERLANNPCE